MKSMRIEQPKSLAAMVADRLRSAIVDGELSLGENISEEKMAENFGVSRTPVRDALAMLQQQGLVTVQSKRGSFVFTPTVEDVTRLCEYRKMLETGTVRIAVERDKARLLERLSATIEAMRAAMSGGDAVAYGRLDTEFHQAFFDCSGNAYVSQAYELVSGQIAALRTHLTRPVAERRQTSFDEHRLFVELVAREDFTGFEALMARHVDRTGEVYLEALGKEAAALDTSG